MGENPLWKGIKRPPRKGRFFLCQIPCRIIPFVMNQNVYFGNQIQKEKPSEALHFQGFEVYARLDSNQ